MKKWLLVLSLSMLLHAEEGLKKVVYDLRTGDTEVFEKSILSGIVFTKNHYENRLEELDVAVVIHGDAYKFFVKNLGLTKYKNDSVLKKKQVEFEKRLVSLSNSYHVTFLMCAVGMKKNNLSKKHIYSFVTPVANSTIGLIDKQNEGYAYIPVR